MDKDLSVALLWDPCEEKSVEVQTYLAELTYFQWRKKLIVVKK